MKKYVHIRINELLEERRISKNRTCKDLDLARGNFNRYCRDEFAVPVIKLAKSLFNNLPSKYQLSGYHVEALAVEAFSAYNGRYTLYDMTRHLLDYSTRRVLNPMNDVTGQSGEIDSNFGGRNSMIRQQLSLQIKNIAGKFSGATAYAKELFE